MAVDATTICKNCGTVSKGKYCNQCGQKSTTSRITLHSIFHEVFHYFTHVENGFGYTLKQLILRPGTMQKEYIEGKRTVHQKPFSMFFLCGTIAGLGYYFINLAYQRIYHEDTATEANFFRHYFVLLQAIMLPFYTLLLWLIFKNKKKNYAEVLVLMLYNFSVIFLALIFINAAKLVFPHYDNRYVEVAFLLLYNNITNIRFFEGNKWIIIAKTVIVLALSYFISQVVNDVVLKLLS